MRALMTLLLLFAVAGNLCGQSIDQDDRSKLTAQDRKELVALDKLETGYAKAKKDYSKERSEAKRKSYVTATMKFADAVLISPALVSKVKYPKALRLYREVLTVEPKNREAYRNKMMIVDIYKSLGKPVPKE